MDTPGTRAQDLQAGVEIVPNLFVVEVKASDLRLSVKIDTDTLRGEVGQLGDAPCKLFALHHGADFAHAPARLRQERGLEAHSHLGRVQLKDALAHELRLLVHELDADAVGGSGAKLRDQLPQPLFSLRVRLRGHVGVHCSLSLSAAGRGGTWATEAAGAAGKSNVNPLTA